MLIDYNSSREELTPEFLERTESKVRTLEKYLDESQSEAHCYIQLRKAVGSHQSGDIWEADINLDTEGEVLHASARRDTLDNALDDVIDEIGREARRHKRRHRNLVRKGGAALKALFRGLGT